MHRLQRIRRTTRLGRRMKASIKKPLTFFQRFLNIIKSKESILLICWILFMLMILGIITTING